MTILRGIVTKTGVMGKTATVAVERTVIHPILLKVGIIDCEAGRDTSMARGSRRSMTVKTVAMNLLGTLPALPRHLPWGSPTLTPHSPPPVRQAFKQHKKYLVHDPLSLAEPGQRVAISLGRKVSARKSFHLDYASPPGQGWAREVTNEERRVAERIAGRIPQDAFRG